MKAEYTFEKTETEDSYAATYYLTENGQRPDQHPDDD